MFSISVLLYVYILISRYLLDVAAPHRVNSDKNAIALIKTNSLAAAIFYFRVDSLIFLNIILLGVTIRICYRGQWNKWFELRTVG